MKPVWKWQYTVSGLIGLGLMLHFLVLWGGFGPGSYAQSYDAYTHIFFASHWLQHWWNAFEPRWYTGFSVFTYPPFAHQLVALPAFGVGLVPAFLGVQTLCLTALVGGMYRYARIWFDPPVAILSAVLLLFSPALTMTLHLFGQYPNLVSLALTLHLLAFVDRFLRDDTPKSARRASLLLGELLLICTGFTSLFANFLGVFFFALPVLIKHWRRTALGRILVLLTLGVGTLVTCLTPFFLYMRSHPLSQVKIPHGSRGNVFSFSMLNYFTFYGLYGIVLPLILMWLVYALWTRRHLGFVFPVFFLLMLSTGGATPFNAWLLGPLFDVLTFDRFAFWNSVLVLPVLAECSWRVYQGLRARQVHPTLYWGIGSTLAVTYLTGFALNLTAHHWQPLPEVLDLTEMQRVLDRPEYQNRRYLTLGIGGNNVSALSTHHQAQSVDGNYNFARRLPELNQAPIALLDDAKYYGPSGIDALAKIILDPRKYHLQLIFLKDQYYTPLLEASGWSRQERLSQGVDVWVSGLTILPPKPAQEEKPLPALAQMIWSLVPLSSFLLMLCVWGYLEVRKHKGTAERSVDLT